MMRHHWTTYGLALLFVFWVSYTASYGWNIRPEPGTMEVWFDTATAVAFGAMASCRWKLVRRDAAPRSPAAGKGGG